MMQREFHVTRVRALRLQLQVVPFPINVAHLHVKSFLTHLALCEYTFICVLLETLRNVPRTLVLRNFFVIICYTDLSFSNVCSRHLHG